MYSNCLTVTVLLQLDWMRIGGTRWERLNGITGLYRILQWVFILDTPKSGGVADSMTSSDKNHHYVHIQGTIIRLIGKL